MDLTHLVDGAGIKKDALGGRRLAGVNVRGNANVPGPFQREWTVLGVDRGNLGFLGNDSNLDGVDSRHEQMVGTGYQRRWAKARLACAILWVSSFFFTTVPVLL